MTLYTVLGVPAALAFSRVVAGSVGLLMHKRFSFSNREQVSNRDIYIYVGLALANYLASAAILTIIITSEERSIIDALIKVLVEVFLFILNFFILKSIFSAK